MNPAYDVFVSYSREDQDRVRPYVEELKNGGVRVFFDTESLHGGTRWQNDIADAIHSAKLVMLFVSKSSLNSEFVPKELALSVDMKKTILPMLLDRTEIRGQVAFCIAGLHRVQAFDPDLKKTWAGLQASLEHAGVEWKSPTRRTMDVRRAQQSQRLNEDDGGNVRLHSGARARSQVATEDVEPLLPPRFLRLWGWLMLAGLGLGAFFWLGGLNVFYQPSKMDEETGKRRGLPKNDASEKVSQVVKAVPVDPEKLSGPEGTRVVKAVPLPTSFEGEAGAMARHYYEVVVENPLGQLPLLADRVDYLGQSWSREEVGQDLLRYRKLWPRQSMMVAEPPQVKIIESGHAAECQVKVTSVCENEVMRCRSNFTGLLTIMKGLREGEPLRIMGVSVVPKSHLSEPPIFLPEGQKRAAVEFVKKAVDSGNSTSGMTADQIANLYMPRPFYFGQEVSHDDIAKQVNKLVSNWEIREYRLVKEPEITSGLGTADVQVVVQLAFLAKSPARGGKTSEGKVESLYSVHFEPSMPPRISRHVEIKR